MRKGLFLIFSVIAIFWIPSIFSQDPIQIEIIGDKDSLTIHIPGNQSVSIQGLGFEVQDDDNSLFYYLNEFEVFKGLLSDLKTPICLRLFRSNVTPILPGRCDGDTTINQVVSNSDVFWYDSTLGNFRVLNILSPWKSIQLCDLSNSVCEVEYTEEWMIQEEEFDGVTMVLVPPACFNMGSSDFNDAQPVHQICFEKYFWIDKYEVTNAQFERFEGIAKQGSIAVGDNIPRDNITWKEALIFVS